MRSSANALPRLSYASPSREQQSPGDATAARPPIHMGVSSMYPTTSDSAKLKKARIQVAQVQSSACAPEPSEYCRS